MEDDTICPTEILRAPDLVEESEAHVITFLLAHSLGGGAAAAAAAGAAPPAAGAAAAAAPPPDGTEPSFSVPAAMTSSRFLPASSFTTRATFSPSASIPTELKIFLMLASLTSCPPC